MLNILQITFILHFLHSIFYDLIWDTTQILLRREENIKLYQSSSYMKVTFTVIVLATASSSDLSFTTVILNLLEQGILFPDQVIIHYLDEFPPSISMLAASVLIVIFTSTALRSWIGSRISTILLCTPCSKISAWWVFGY